jgi:hypothetical protein
MLFPDRWLLDSDISEEEHEAAVEQDARYAKSLGKTRTELVRDEAGWTIQSAPPEIYDEEWGEWL